MTVRARPRLSPDEAFQLVLQHKRNPHKACRHINDGIALDEIKLYVNGSLVDPNFFAANYQLALKKSADGLYHAIIWPTRPLTDPSGNWEVDARDIKTSLKPGPGKKSQTGTKAGRDDWERLLIEAAVYLWEHGIPKKDGDLYAHLKNLVGDLPPGETQLKVHIGPLLRRLGKVK